MYGTDIHTMYGNEGKIMFRTLNGPHCLSVPYNVRLHTSYTMNIGFIHCMTAPVLSS